MLPRAHLRALNLGSTATPSLRTLVQRTAVPRTAVFVVESVREVLCPRRPQYVSVQDLSVLCGVVVIQNWVLGRTAAVRQSRRAVELSRHRAFRERVAREWMKCRRVEPPILLPHLHLPCPSRECCCYAPVVRRDIRKAT